MIGGKVKAGALQFAILISVVIAMVIAAFIMLTYTQLQFAKQLQFSASSIELCHTGIAYAKKENIVYNDTVSVVLENNEQQRLQLLKSHWGIFDKVVALGKHKNFSHKKIGLLGGQMLQKERSSIYLEDTNSPLVLVGKTAIYGNAQLPPKGVKAGVIAGNYYQGKTLIHGGVKLNATTLPLIPVEKRRYIQQLLFGRSPDQDTLYIPVNTTGAIKHTFQEASKWMYSPGVITLRDQEFTDNIIIKSDTLIRVSAFAKAENILLIAPHISIEDGVAGSFQAFASQAITVGNNVRLSYPSALVCYEDESQKSRTSSTPSNEIRIGADSQVEGSIIDLRNTRERIIQPTITLEETATLTGEIYSEGAVQILGTVRGSVYTHQFASKARGSLYQNHLYNAVIDSRDFPTSFCGLMTAQTHSNLVQWVY